MQRQQAIGVYITYFDSQIRANCLFSWKANIHIDVNPSEKTTDLTQRTDSRSLMLPRRSFPERIDEEEEEEEDEDEDETDSRKFLFFFIHLSHE